MPGSYVSSSMYGELISRPVTATKTGQASSRQYRATPSVLNILAVYQVYIFVWRRHPFAYKRGVGDALPSLGSAVRSRFTCGSPCNRKGMVSFSVLSTNTKQASPQSVRFHANIQRAKTAVGSARRFYQYIYSSVY